MALLTKWDPFAEIEALQRQLFGGDLMPAASGVPAMDVYEDEGRLVVETHVPGFTKDQVQIDVHEGALEIRAEKQDKEEDKGKRKYLLRESATSFYRRLRLPKQADTDKIEASFGNGALKVIVPYKELPKPKSVAIKELKA